MGLTSMLVCLQKDRDLKQATVKVHAFTTSFMVLTDSVVFIRHVYLITSQPFIPCALQRNKSIHVIIKVRFTAEVIKQNWMDSVDGTFNHFIQKISVCQMEL